MVSEDVLSIPPIRLCGQPHATCSTNPEVTQCLPPATGWAPHVHCTMSENHLSPTSEREQMSFICANIFHVLREFGPHRIV